MANDEVEQPSAPPSSIRPFFIFIALLASLLYASAGFQPVAEIQFAALASVYLALLSRLAFPPVSRTRPPSPYAGIAIFKYYISLGAIVGLLLPFLLLLLGLSRRDPQIYRPLVPHTALLLFQILSERVTFVSDSVSFPIRAFVPISYNARRLFSIWSWMESEFASEQRGGVLAGFAKFVAVANCVFWSFNLFCFLLPMFLPLAMRRYYQQALEKEE